jgi:hypothetical protein
MTETLFVMLGMAIWAFFSYIFNTAKQLIYLRQVEKIALLMLSTVIADIEYIKVLKYKTMQEEGIDDNKRKRIQNSEEQTLKQWKDLAIRNMISVYPDKFKRHLQYYNWSTAIDWLQTETDRSKYGRRKK